MWPLKKKNNSNLSSVAQQVNASADVLQLFEISKLCDGTPNCFQGSDESNAQLKCTSKFKPTQSLCFAVRESAGNVICASALVVGL